MRDYEELVKRLRSVKDIWQSEEEQWMLDAADAIEELQKALDVVNDAHNGGYDVGYWAGRRDYEPKWISVEERLPEEEKTVLVVRKFLSAKGVTVRTYVETAELIGGDWVSMSDEYKIIRYRHTDPIYWMPLPEPPKEGQQHGS